MKQRFNVFLVAIMSALLSSCNFYGISMNDAGEGSAAAHAAEHEHFAKNPEPRVGYRVRLRVENAPGSFEIVRMGGQYDVRNESRCGRINPMTDTPGRMTSMERMPFARVSGNEYESVIYLDEMQDEDYYGRGICNWELSLAYAVVIAKDERRDTGFAIRLSAHDLMSGGSVTRYYPYASYPRVEGVEGFPSNGKLSQEEYLPDLRSALFSLTLSMIGEAE